MFARSALALATLMTLTMPGYTSSAQARAQTELAHLAGAELSPLTLALPGSHTRIPLASTPATAPHPAQHGGCEAELPVPTGRWAGRDSDDEWTRGLFPAVDDYGEVLALTFDDGPHRTRTPIALDELARHGMHATFFLTGNAVRSSTYELVRRMVDEGHALANHGWRHDTQMAALGELSPAELEAYIRSEFELTQIRVDLAFIADSPESFAALDKQVFAGLHRFRHSREQQLERMPGLRARHRAVLERHGYGEQDRPYTMDYVRPPGGNPYIGGRWSTQEREIFAKAINGMGLTMVMWNAGSGDSNTRLSPTERRDPARVAATARSSAAKGGIYIAHDRIAPAALESMLSSFAASEVEIVSLDALREIKLRSLGVCG